MMCFEQDYDNLDLLTFMIMTLLRRATVDEHGLIFIGEERNPNFVYLRIGSIPAHRCVE